MLTQISCQQFEIQVKKATETHKLLEEKLKKVQESLQKDPESAYYRRELKKVMLDITITNNELEHAMNDLENCKVNSFY